MASAYTGSYCSCEEGGGALTFIATTGLGHLKHLQRQMQSAALFVRLSMISFTTGLLMMLHGTSELSFWALGCSGVGVGRVLPGTLSKET